MFVYIYIYTICVFIVIFINDKDYVICAIGLSTACLQHYKTRNTLRVKTSVDPSLMRVKHSSYAWKGFNLKKIEKYFYPAVDKNTTIVSQIAPCAMLDLSRKLQECPFMRFFLNVASRHASQQAITLVIWES